MKTLKIEPLKLAGYFLLSLLIASIAAGLVMYPRLTGQTEKVSSVFVPQGSLRLPSENLKTEKTSTGIMAMTSGELYDKFMKEGKLLYKTGEYRQAMYLFHQADAQQPQKPEAKYYLMLSWSRIEANPFESNSKTIRYALETKALAPSSKYAEKADSLIKKYEQTTANSVVEMEIGGQKVPVKTVELKPSKIKTRTVIVKEKTPMPRLPGKSSYPRAATSTAKDEPLIEEPEEPAEKTDKSDKGKRIVLKVALSRPDEKGMTITPSGADLRLINLRGSESYRATTNSKGEAVFENVKPSENYVLAAISKYKYVRYVQEFYYYNGRPVYPNNNYPNRPGTSVFNPYSPPPVSVNQQNSSKGGVQGQVTYTENNQGKVGIGPFSASNYRISTGDGYIYYGSNHPTGWVDWNGQYRDYMRPVEYEDNFSWHVRLDLNKPGAYGIELTGGNSDSKFIADLEPNYNPVTREPYDEITKMTPVPIAINEE